MERNFLPVFRPVFPSSSELQADFERVLSSGQVTNGEYVKRFEEAIADYLGVQHVVAFCNGETALIAMLSVLPPETEVIVPAYTFSGTIHALMWNRLTPVFTDVDERTWTLSPQAVEENITRRTGAILAVPIFGNPVDIDALEAICDDHHLPLFFDSAQAFGGGYKGKRLGGFGEAESFSFHATKVFSTMEGGCVSTNNESIYRAMLNIREFGKTMDKADCSRFGLNGKMTEIAAIVGLKNLGPLDVKILYQNGLVQLYRQALADIEGITFQDTTTPDSHPAWMLFQIVTVQKDRIQKALTEVGIEARTFMCPPTHHLEVYKRMYALAEQRKSSAMAQLPNTERIAYNSLALPLHQGVTEAHIDQITRIIKETTRDYHSNPFTH